ncbi:MAG TPA: DUF2271 domain-containing protein [Bacteroidales bacterium]
MKRMNRFSNVFLVLFLGISSTLFAQDNPNSTAGELTFTVRTVTDNGTYSPKHVLAIWVEDTDGFVKSRLVRANQRKQYLYKWVASSNNNVVDATTGATLSSHQTHTVTWDCTDLTGAEVPDGEYHIFVEYTDKHAQGPWTMVTFTKGPDEVHITPEDLPYLKDMQLDFIPLINSIDNLKDSENAIVYPNPGKGIFHIQNVFSGEVSVQLFDIQGKQVFNSSIQNSLPNSELSIDLSDLPNGTYVIDLSDGNKHFVNKLIKQ